MDDLKALRQQKHLTQKRLGGLGRRGSRHPQVVGVRHRRSHGAEHILRLAEALGLDAQQLPAMLRESAAEKRRRARAGLKV